MAIIYDKKLDVPIVHTYAQIGMPIIYAESYEQRLERRLEWEDKNHKVPNVVAVRERPEGNYAVKEQFLAANLVTDTGEIAYAQKAAGATVTNDFWAAGARFAVRDNATPLTPTEGDDFGDFTNHVAGSVKARTGGYPLQGTDPDGDNTGDGANVVAWSVNYLTGDFNATNVSGLTYSSDTTPTTGEASPILFHAAFTAFAKTATDTLKFFVNHTFENQ